jgi:hypothetical protein
VGVVSEIVDASGRTIMVGPGSVGDEPVAAVSVLPLGEAHSRSRPAVVLWLCAEQLDALVEACLEAVREASR